ncbi:hypothetical protein ACFONL_01095 [Camelimonas fluminis]|uniref:Uncharacterized protein n=1 Tax=Camelimonas fluminis TaxID=1576911 RepID=A0ABV7UBV6_9HYPH|nr:hypothetical protein [Camelimonas fluminis]
MALKERFEPPSTRGTLGVFILGKKRGSALAVAAFFSARWLGLISWIIRIFPRNVGAYGTASLCLDGGFPEGAFGSEDLDGAAGKVEWC